MLRPGELQGLLDEIRQSGLSDISPVEAQLLAAMVVADSVQYVADQLEVVEAALSGKDDTTVAGAISDLLRD
ncbi:MAG: hypothetical protein ACREMZ_12905 [Gemmatimonadales bacterium]